MKQIFKFSAAVMLLVCAIKPSFAGDTGRTVLPVVIVADFVNDSKTFHSTTARTATDAIAVELDKHHVYEVVTRREIDKAARERGLHAPYSTDDLRRVAKDMSVNYIVSGEVHHVDRVIQDKILGYEVGLIVRVRDVDSGELVNGAAAVGFAGEGTDKNKTLGVLEMDAVTEAAMRAVLKIGAYTPISGTVMSSPGNGPMVLNRGLGHGVKKHQEFLIFRKGINVGRASVGKVSGSYSELNVLDNSLGIQPQDQALSIFPEPKFPGGR
jgi:TolB-like protein